jgi:site-specific DNA-methyltransferase (adenine-specific)
MKIKNSIKQDIRGLNKIYLGDCLKSLKRIPDNYVDCVITSPPYWALRDYGVKNQIGREKSPVDYINNILEILKECKRIIKPTGTIFLNIGDSYYNRALGHKCDWLRPKQKLLIPYRIAISAQCQLGLILRNDIKWIKTLTNWKTKESWGNAIPSSAKDRFNTVSESILFFVKNEKYYFDLNKVRIPHKESSLKREKTLYKTNSESPYAKQFNVHGVKKSCHPNGKNPSDCLMFPFEPSRELHFAMFPSKLPEFCMLAGCPEGGIVLDPFMGSGTTALVCKRLKRNFIGLEINREYLKTAERRLKEIGGES